MAWGGTHPTPPVPPTEVPGRGAVPVRIESGFFADMPPRSITFLEREFLRPFKRPTIFEPGPPPPREINFVIGAFKILERHVVVIRDVAFQAFRAGTIDPNSSVPVAPGALSTFLGYTLDFGNHGPHLDHQNNVDGPGGVVQNTLPIGANVASAYPTVYGQIKGFSEGGSLRARFGKHFALYAGAGQTVTLGYSVLRPPPVEVTLVAARAEGWMIPSVLFDRLLAKNKGTM